MKFKDYLELAVAFGAVVIGAIFLTLLVCAPVALVCYTIFKCVQLFR